MNSTVEIVELNNDKYELHEEALRAVISLAEKCDSISLISIIGPKHEGKTFFINCLINYLESNDIEAWPKVRDSIIKWNYGFQDQYNTDVKPVIKMWSKPFILKDDNQNIAVFLMESSHVFNKFSEILSSKIMRDMMKFFMHTSSTVIYNTSCVFLMNKDKDELLKRITKNFEFINSIKSSTELIDLIRDWDLIFGTENYSLGLKGGKEFFSHNLIEKELKPYWDLIDCYLIPSPTNDVRCIDWNLSDLNDRFIEEITDFIKNKLLNSNKMVIKTRLESNQPVKAKEFIELFKKFITELNIDSQQTILENNNKSSNGSHSGVSDSNILNSYETKISPENRITKKNCSGSRDDSMNINTTETVKLMPNQKIEDEKQKENIIFNAVDNSDDVIDFSDDKKELNSSICTVDISKNITTYIESETSSLKESNKVENLQNEDEVMKEKLLELSRELLIKFKDDIKNSNIKLDIKMDSIKVYNDVKSNILCSFDKRSKDIFPKNLFSEQRKDLSELIDYEREESIRIVDSKITKARNEFELAINNSIDYFNKNMKSALDLSTKFDSTLERLIIRLEEIPRKSLEVFEKQNFCKGIVGKELNKKFKDKLDDENEKYKTIIDCINLYEFDWKLLFDNKRCMSLEIMEEQNYKYKKKYNQIIQKFNDQALTDHLMLLLDKRFDSFTKINENIIKYEKIIADKAIDLTFDLYCDALKQLLKSGLFSQNEIISIHEELVDYTLKGVKTSCEFNDDQHDLIEYCEKEVNNRIQRYFASNSSKYYHIYIKTTTLLKKVKDEAFEKYCLEMSNILSDKPFLKANKFEEIHQKIIHQIFLSHLQSLESIKFEFNESYFREIVLESKNDIERDIKFKREQFKKKNDAKASKTSSIAIYFGHKYLISAVHDQIIQYIPDNFNEKMRPNCIAFADNILFGTEAKNYIEGNFPKNLIDENFDIKQLLAKNRNDFQNEELSSYPFEFIGHDYLRVKSNINFIKQDFSIEALIALQVLDIKLDAEKQFGNSVTDALFTIPSHFNLRQKKAFRNVAKIAGLENVDILSEMSAIALGYRFEGNKAKTISKRKMIMIFIIDDFECEAAICSVENNKIQFMRYNNQNLFKSFKRKFYSLFFKEDKEKNPNEVIYKAFKHLINNTLDATRFRYENINDCIIAGQSLLIPQIKEWIPCIFNRQLLFSCDPLDIMIDGSIVYSQMLKNQIEMIDIFEVSIYPINILIKGHLSSYKKNIPNSTSLPKIFPYEIDSAINSHNPIKISVFQEDMLVKVMTVKSPHRKDYIYESCRKFHVECHIDECGEITLKIIIPTYKKTENIVEIIESELGLNEDEIEEGRDIVIRFEQQFKANIKLKEEKCLTDRAMDDLNSSYIEIKKLVDNNTSLHKVKKKLINEELKKTLNLINLKDSKNIDIKTIEEQKKQLEKTVDMLLFKK